MTKEEQIKQWAYNIGFSFCGISKARQLEQEAKDLEHWLQDGRNGSMSYMENHFDKRIDPRLLVPGAKTVVSLMYNYFPEPKAYTEKYKVSKYALGEDYHFVVKDRMYELFSLIKDKFGEVEGRVFVDSAPVMDKHWAKNSGLGWIGKNTNLITKSQGSFLFISELIIDLELEEDGPIKDYCGTCTKCIDACPTGALDEPYQIKGDQCISYFTIELKDQVINHSDPKAFDQWIFGCDICQDVCPWNRFSKPHQESRFVNDPDLRTVQSDIWEQMSPDLFAMTLHKKSPLKRAKLNGLIRNIQFINS